MFHMKNLSKLAIILENNELTAELGFSVVLEWN